MLILLDGRWHQVTRVWTRVNGRLVGNLPSGPDRVVTRPQAHLHGGGEIPGEHQVNPAKSVKVLERECAEAYGAKFREDRHRGSGWGLYELNGWTVWTDGRSWKRARLVDGHYTDHHTHASLGDALRAALGK